MSDVSEGMQRALGRIVSGCFVLTTVDMAGRPFAILLSFVQQVGFDPPRIVLAIRRDRSVIPLLDRVGAFVLNICSQDDDQFLRRFARPDADADRLFSGLAVERVPQGVVLPNCAGYLVCRNAQKVESGDHVLYIADVLGGASAGANAPYVHTRRNGMSY